MLSEITVNELLARYPEPTLQVLDAYGIEFDDWDRAQTLEALCDAYDLDVDQVVGEIEVTVEEEYGSGEGAWDDDDDDDDDDDYLDDEDDEDEDEDDDGDDYVYEAAPRRPARRA